MLPITHIRKKIFDVNQAAFGAIAGTTQASVSRWDNGLLQPSQSEMARIRAAARERGLAWNDSWFFEVPAVQPADVAA